MLETDYQRELTARLAELPCLIEVPLALRRRLGMRGIKGTTVSDRRRFARFACFSKAVLEVETTIKSIPRSSEVFLVLTLDVSREGIAFLHSQELFPGEVPRLALPTGALFCRVVRCVRHGSNCFEIGASFESGAQPQNWIRSLTGDQMLRGAS